MTEEQRTDWSRIAAWVFGVWSLMLPLSAGIVAHYQSRIVASQETYRAEIMALRVEVMQQNSLQAEQIAGIIARQMEVMRRLDDLEDGRLDRPHR